ncbi:MFS transporter [Candidimonas nitroreducens]|uniref:MFS transporter n=1 Tax=Candidimonas nitroreducens TaxID=683354 RepID=A0A225MLK1_9BURK|nr:MFS transporter [Candidimonas nitroreducens]OWT62084.1 MFS transporter [Candidimonas nitroreducens]
MKNSSVSEVKSRRHPLRDVLLACMLVLLLAQGLIGALSLSALNRQIIDNTADRVQLLARQTSDQIQNGMRLGKPLAQFFGLSAMLDDLQHRIPDLSGASVVLADGQALASVGTPLQTAALLRDLRSNLTDEHGHARAAGPGSVHQADAQGIRVAVPLLRDHGSLQGAVVLQVHPQEMRQSTLMIDNLTVLGLSTLCAAIVLGLAFRYAMPLYEVAAASRARMLVPLLVLLLAQGVYAAYTIHTFRDVWIRVTRDNTQVLAQGLQGSLDRVLGYGIEPTHLRGVEQPMARLASAFPVIGELRLVDAQGRLLNRANAHGAMPLAGAAPAEPHDTLSFPLKAQGKGPVLASLQVLLDPRLLAAGIRARALDAATVAAVALVAAIELLLLLNLLMDRAFAVRAPSAGGEPVGLDDPSNVGAIVRPVMFGFLFAMALPLSFLPIYARSLVGDAPGQGALLMALPIAAEMACGLLTALLAGRLSDRRGWQFPVLAGLLGSVAGNLACALAGSLPAFIVARGLVGLGYGLTWMGLQGFIVIRSPAAYRGRNMALVVAGLFAGHLSGAAVGAMLMQQLGPVAVFVAGAVLLALPTLGVFTLMWPYRHVAGTQKATQVIAGPVIRSWKALRELLATRDFGMLLLGCVVPFSIAQVGLLTYALPLYMEEYHASAATVGRILMLYGFCVIYVGPYMGRLADRSAYKKYWIAAGGVIGSVGLLSLYFASGVVAAGLAVVLLALASCLAGGAQTAYMLSLDHVQRYGAGGATSVMRAADKFGQMLGPLAVGALFASVGISGGLALTGVLYLVATLAFLVLAPLSSAPALRAS